jgi:beta-lactamase regulating signal transducer with metallopeptidase domain
MWWVGERLLTGSVQGAFAVALVWLVCRNVAAIPASARAFIWWLVSLKLVLALAPLPALPVPVLPAANNAAAAARSLAIETLTSPRVLPAALPLPAQARADNPVRPVSPARTVNAWLAAAMGLWLAVVTALTLHLLRVYVRLRGAVRSSTPIGAEDADTANHLARLLALKKTPDVRTSDRVTTPLVAGMFRPTVLIPAQALATLSPGERAMAICHEFAHVRRRDLLLGWVPALAERLFFFHPLARFAAREYVVAREAACDTLVLRAMDVAPQEYGRMLVRLGVGGLDPAFMAAGSSPSISSLRRRLDMLQHFAVTGSRRHMIWLLVAVSALTFVPLRLVARAPLQAQVAPAEAAAPVVVSAEQGPGPSQDRESVQARPAGPVSTEVFLAQTAEDSFRRAEAEYRRTVERERVADYTSVFLKSQYEAKLRDYESALIDFTGNQESAEVERVLEKANALAQQQSEVEQLRLKLQDAAKVLQLIALARQKAEEARQTEREATRSRLEAELSARAQAGTLDPQTGLARQLEALTIAQQKLGEQLENLVAQQDQLLTIQRQLSNQVEVLRELERLIRMVSRPPGAAAPATAAPVAPAPPAAAPAIVAPVALPRPGAAPATAAPAALTPPAAAPAAPAK